MNSNPLTNKALNALLKMRLDIRRDTPDKPLSHEEILDLMHKSYELGIAQGLKLCDRGGELT